MPMTEDEFQWIRDIKPIPPIGTEFIVDKYSIHKNREDGKTYQPFKYSNEHMIITVTNEIDGHVFYKIWSSRAQRFNRRKMKIPSWAVSELIEENYWRMMSHHRSKILKEK